MSSERNTAVLLPLDTKFVNNVKKSTGNAIILNVPFHTLHNTQRFLRIVATDLQSIANFFCFFAWDMFCRYLRQWIVGIIYVRRSLCIVTVIFG
jgi:hypothetical protein